MLNMEMSLKAIIYMLAIITTALSAGIFFAWVFTVIPGTRKITDQAYLETMQSINKEILNPGFFIVFFGAVLFLIVNTFFHYQVKIDTAFHLSLSATLIYLIGTIGITMVGNVPLNNIVEAMDLSTFSMEDFKEARLAYEVKWNQFNMVRMLAAFISFVLLLFGWKT